MTYTDGASALDGFKTSPPDLAILDIKMPRMDGMETLRRLRQKSDMPVIFLTSKDEEIDELFGLKMGADDFIRKPFSQRLLVERVKAVLRRVCAQGADRAEGDRHRKVLERGLLRMDPERHTCTWKNEPVTLTVTEFLILQALATRPGVVKSRNALMDAAYDDQVYVDDRTIDSHIKRLRKKFKPADDDFDMIETLYGVGYRFKESLRHPVNSGRSAVAKRDADRVLGARSDRENDRQSAARDRGRAATRTLELAERLLDRPRNRRRRSRGSMPPRRRRPHPQTAARPARRHASGCRGAWHSSSPELLEPHPADRLFSTSPACSRSLSAFSIFAVPRRPDRCARAEPARPGRDHRRRDRRIRDRRNRHHHDRSRPAAGTAGRRELRPQRRGAVSASNFRSIPSASRRCCAADLADQDPRAHLRPRRHADPRQPQPLWPRRRAALRPAAAQQPRSPGCRGTRLDRRAHLARARRPAALSRTRPRQRQGLPEVAQALDGQKASIVRINERGEVIVSVAVPVQRFRAVRGALLLSTQGGEIDQMVDGGTLVDREGVPDRGRRHGDAVGAARRHHRRPGAATRGRCRAGAAAHQARAWKFPISPRGATRSAICRARCAT